MPRSTEKRVCLICRVPLGAGPRAWCAACHLAIAAHQEIMKLLQPHAGAAPLRAADPARLARIARYEERASLGLPLFR